MTQRAPLTDHQLLELMHMLEAEGLTSAEAARHMGHRLGLTRSAVCGLRFRVNNDTDAEETRALKPGEVGFGQGPVERPENMDGGMPAKWWLDAARGAA